MVVRTCSVVGRKRMGEFLQQAFILAEHSPAVLVTVMALLLAVILIFLGWFIVPWVSLRLQIGRLLRQVRSLKSGRNSDPRRLAVPVS